MKREIIAKRLNISIGSVGRYERGERPATPEIINGWAQITKVDPAWLLTGRGDPAHPPSQNPVSPDIDIDAKNAHNIEQISDYLPSVEDMVVIRDLRANIEDLRELGKMKDNVIKDLEDRIKELEHPDDKQERSENEEVKE